MSEAKAFGVDIGSTTWKAVAVDADGKILAHILEPTDPLIDRQTERALAQLREKVGADESTPVGATGYGRKRVNATRKITEITCHAKGAFHITGKGGVLIDIGGQDTKVIRIGDKGEVLDFHMNDKCAAGTGRFLEVILARLKVPLDEIAQRVAQAQKAVSVSSTCTVFAESEVVSLVAQGEPVDDIVKGLMLSLASRVASLAGNLPEGREIFMSGGVARNPAMVDALAETTSRPVAVVNNPQLVGALGAALAVLKG